MLRDFPYIAFALIAACRAGVEFHKCALAPLSRLLRPLTRPSRETREQFGFGDIDTYVRRPSIQQFSALIPKARHMNSFLENVGPYLPQLQGLR